MKITIKEEFWNDYRAQILEVIAQYSNLDLKTVLDEFYKKILCKICDTFQNAEELKEDLFCRLGEVKTLNYSKVIAPGICTDSLHEYYDDLCTGVFRISSLIDLCDALNSGTDYLFDADYIFSLNEEEILKQCNIYEETSTAAAPLLFSSEIKDTISDDEINTFTIFFIRMRNTYPIDKIKIHDLLEEWLNTCIYSKYTSKIITENLFNRIIALAETLEGRSDTATKFAMGLEALSSYVKSTIGNLEILDILGFIDLYKKYYTKPTKTEYLQGDLVNARIIDDNATLCIVVGKAQSEFIVKPLKQFGLWETYLVDSTKLEEINL